MKGHNTLATAIAVVLTAALALPALAGVEEGTVVVSGVATVGSSASPIPLPQNGRCTVTGKGLHFPGFHDGSPAPGKGHKTTDKNQLVAINKEVYYRLGIDTVNAILLDTNSPTGSGQYTGSLDVCGIVSPGKGGIGAACGSSTGRNGKGKLILDQVEVPGPPVDGPFRVFDVQNVAWPPALVGKLAVYGHIKRVNATKTTKFSTGTFQGVIDATGAGPCFLNPKKDPKRGGATNFTVAGVVVAVGLGAQPGTPNTPKLPK